MESKKPKDFDKEAAEWDLNPGRVKLAHEVADAIIREIQPDASMDALDFGCGTGLVTLLLQPRVKSITGADSSKGMLAMLEKKITMQGLTNVRIQHVDFEQGGRVQGRFQLIISSMMLHHVPDTAALLSQWRELLVKGGRLCIADLDMEDGSFHGDNTGVFHRGFARGQVMGLLRDAGFSEVRSSTAATMVKEVEGRGKKEFPVFLISAVL